MKNAFVTPGIVRILILSVFTAFLSATQGISQIETITSRLRADLISQSVNENEITSLISSLRTDGSWPDIDYTNTSITNWDPVNHSRRLVILCRAFNKSSSSYFHSGTLKSKIVSALDYYLTVNPKSANWWWNAIGAPTNFGPVLVLMKTGDSNGFDQATLDYYADKLLNYYTESAQKWPSATTGANKIWLLKSSIDKACVKNNEDVLRQNFTGAFEEAKIFTGKAEGIKSDFSFYQHGPQLYAGGYGLSFMSDISYFGQLAAGTTYRMNDEQTKVLTDVMLEGFQWFTQHSGFDYGACGREISRAGATSSSSLKTVVTRLKIINPAREAELTSCYNFLDGKGNFAKPGNRHFWKSDIMVQHGADFYLSARFPSNRMYATERMNNENLKRKWLPWGSTNIMIDGDEYRNLYAVWDWSRIPGVTSVLENVPSLPVTGSAYLTSATDFAGGVSDGETGIAAYDFSWDTVYGKKGWFFTPDALYCFGTAISANKSSDVITSVNQCFSSGTVTVRNKNSRSALDKPELVSNELKWVHHDRIGYLFPAGGEINIRNTDQTGSWYDINLSQSQSPVTQKVFSAWIDHSPKPVSATYEYIVVPSKSVTQFEKWVESNPLKMVKNTPDIQAVYDKNRDVFGVIFYKPGNVILEAGLIIWSDKPCLLLLKREKYKNSITLYAADPTQKLASVKIRISKKMNGTGTTVNSDNTTTVEILLPEGDLAGSTTKVELLSEAPVSVVNRTFVAAFPNPTRDFFYISDHSSVKSMNVTDQSGRKLIDTAGVAPETIGEKWSPGIYFLNIEYSDMIIRNQRLLKVN